MRIDRPVAWLTAAAVLVSAHAARADLLIKVDKSTQRVTVTVNGQQLYDWPVSTGGSGYDTPSGTFKPFRMDIDHHSEEWDNAPMPYSVFFTKTGDALHGTYEQRSLGRAVSHGCVRLSVKNAATLWKLVQQEKMANTTVVLSGRVRGAEPPPTIASSQPAPSPQPMPSGADDPRYGVPPQEVQGYQNQPVYDDQPRYDEQQPSYERPRYGDRPPSFPFFFFGR